MQSRSLFISTLVFFGLFVSLVTGCGGGSSSVPGEAPFSPQLSQEISTAFDEGTREPSIVGALVRVTSAKTGFVFKKASGAATPTQALDADDPFYSASIGKMITATLVLKYAEEGRLSLADKASKFLPRRLLENLLVIDGIDLSSSITLRQLLNHTSGLDDLLAGGELDDNGFNAFYRALLADKESFWSAERTIEFVRDNLPPVGRPGQGFEYSDTNYLVLGRVIEAVSGKTLQAEAKQRIFDVLGMNQTYYFKHDTARGSAASRVASWSYLAELPLTFEAMSFDWAAGGLITTAEDLKRFLRQVIKGDSLNAASKAAMREWQRGETQSTDYGLGLERLNLGPQAPCSLVGHGGATNSAAYYCEKLDLFLVGTFNQIASDKRIDDLFARIVAIVQKYD